MKFKIAVIGAGSMVFTRLLIRDTLSVEAFQDIDITFMDINAEYLRMAAEMCQKDIDDNHLNIKIQTTLSRRDAVKDAKYILNFARIGGLEGLASDTMIPMKYGVDQCVADTLCAGGIMYGQRGIAELMELCKDIREVSLPDAMMLSYANPCAMMTMAAIKYGGVPTIGLCHGVGHTLNLLARVLEVDPHEINTVCVGINHQTWFTKLDYHGEDLNLRLIEGFEKHPEIAENEKLRIDMRKNFGYFSTESNGHLGEYVAWYRKRPETIQEYNSRSAWIHGESAGYLRECAKTRNYFEENFDEWIAAEPYSLATHERSIEHGSYIIEGLETGKLYRGYFNVENKGAITNLPDDSIVEVPGYVDGTGINIPVVGDLPLGCAAVCSQSIWVQKLAVEAAIHGDIQLLRQAMLLDPLVGAVCTPPEVFQMVDEMLIDQAEFLPQYAAEIELAKERMKTPRCKTNENYKGAFRKEDVPSDDAHPADLRVV